MTIVELEIRLRTVEAELQLLKAQVAPKSWLDLYGAYADDPTFAEAMRLGREERERINRESLEEMDRQEEEAVKPKAKSAKKPAKRRGSNARA